MTTRDLKVDPAHLLNFIGGAWTPSASGTTRANTNPADLADVIGDFAESVAADVTTAVDAAEAAQQAWDAIGPIERAKVLSKAGRLIEERIDEITEAITREQGKRLSEARNEVTRGLTILDFHIGEPAG